MLFLSFALLFAGVHVTAWSHEHSDSAEHAIEASHSDNHHDSGHDASERHDSGDKSDFSSEVVHHHFYPAGIEVAVLDFGHRDAQKRAVEPLGSAARLASLTHAPPIEPPAA